MIDLFNMIAIAIAMFISGLAFHSGYLHAKAKYGWTFPWDHDEGESSKQALKTGICVLCENRETRKCPNYSNVVGCFKYRKEDT